MIVQRLLKKRYIMRIRTTTIETFFKPSRAFLGFQRGESEGGGGAGYLVHVTYHTKLKYTVMLPGPLRKASE
jgi:hypothetical protein